MARRHRLHKGRWARLRREVLERDGYRCVRCGRAGRLEVDHIVPVSKGGDPWDKANLQTLCRGEHIAKTRGENRRPDPARDRWTALVSELEEEYTSVQQVT